MAQASRSGQKVKDGKKDLTRQPEAAEHVHEEPNENLREMKTWVLKRMKQANELYRFDIEKYVSLTAQERQNLS